MSKKTLSVYILSLCFVFAVSAISWAVSDPSGLVVVRASDSSLWKATCNGTTCSSFSSITGAFASQPTLYWDEDAQLYILWGRASNSTIYRSTFNRFGVFNNDWALVPGLTESPIAGAGGGIMNNWTAHNSLDNTGVVCTTTLGDIDNTAGLYAPVDGFYAVSVSGVIEHYRSFTSGTNYARIYLTDTSGTDFTSWSYSDVPDGTPTGYTSFPFSTSRWFTATGGQSKAFYVTCLEGGTASATATTTIRNVTFNVSFQPYAY